MDKKVPVQIVSHGLTNEWMLPASLQTASIFSASISID
jgi:hypothetical protein